jgi:hypothetical protein
VLPIAPSRTRHYVEALSERNFLALLIVSMAADIVAQENGSCLGVEDSSDRRLIQDGEQGSNNPFFIRIRGLLPTRDERIPPFTKRSCRSCGGEPLVPEILVGRGQGLL